MQEKQVNFFFYFWCLLIQATPNDMILNKKIMVFFFAFNA